MPVPYVTSMSDSRHSSHGGFFLFGVLLVTMLSLAAPADAAPLSGILQDAVAKLESLIADAGPLGPVLFILAYAASAVALIPASVLTVAAGFLFGPVAGTLVVSAGSTLGAAAAFLVGRYLARPTVTRSASARFPRFAAVDKSIADQGAKIVFLLRLSPAVPYTLLNYALGLTSIEFVPYLVASWVGMLPGTVAYVAIGGAGKAAAESAAGGLGPVEVVLYIVGAAATLGATVLISRAATRALQEAEEGGEENG